MEKLKKVLMEYGMERVDEKMMEEQQYKVIMEKINRKSEELESKMPNITMKDVEALTACYVELTAYQAGVNYIQGIRDAGKLLVLLALGE